MFKPQTKDKQLIEDLKQKNKDLEEENRKLRQEIECREEAKNITADIHSRTIDAMSMFAQFGHVKKEETT